MRNAPERPVTVESPGLYTIVVQGHLDPGWSDRLGGMQVTLGISDDSVSQLTGWLIDQTALHGVLSTLHGLSLPILSVDRVR